jgi:hypothetical protein
MLSTSTTEHPEVGSPACPPARASLGFWSSRRVKAIAPWLVSALLLAYPLATTDLHAVAAAFAQADYVRHAILLALFASLTLLVDGYYLCLAFRWLCGVGRYRDLVRARGAAYLLTIVSAFVGLGGLVAYMKRVHGVSYQRGSGVVLVELLHEVGALGTWAVLGVFWIEHAMPSIAPMVEPARSFGYGAVLFFLACFILSRVDPFGDKAPRVLSVFRELSARQFWALYAIKLFQNVFHGVFVAFTVIGFQIATPPSAGFALSHVVRMVRGLPVSAFGLGVDQVSFAGLFGAWDASGSRILAYSLVYTFSMFVARALLGLLFVRGIFSDFRSGSAAPLD